MKDYEKVETKSVNTKAEFRNRSACLFVIAQLIDLNIQKDDLTFSWVIPLLSLRREIGIYSAVI